MGRVGFPADDAEGISERLRDFYLVGQEGRRPRAASNAELARMLDTKPNTVSGWFRGKKSKVPDGPQLARMAQLHNLSLKYLLLGKGLPTDGEPLQAHIVAGLRSQGVSEWEAELVVRSDNVERLVASRLAEVQNVRKGVAEWLGTPATKAIFGLFGKRHR